MSFWERVGEGIGYGLAALVLGPPAAISRSERRRIRRAFVAWCDAHDATKIEAPRGVARRAIALPTKLGKLPVRAELDVNARRARIEATIAPLPTFVRAAVIRDGALRVESDVLDPASRAALRDRIAAGKLGDLHALAIGVASEELVVVAIALTTPEAWRALGDGVVDLAEWLAEKWPVGYRG